MPTLPSGVLAELQAQAAQLLPDTATIQYQTVTVNGQKHGTNSWTTRATGVACRLAAETLGHPRPDAGERLFVRQPWIVTLPSGQTVALRDQILIGARTFTVLEFVGGSWEITRRVRCVEIT